MVDENGIFKPQGPDVPKDPFEKFTKAVKEFRQSSDFKEKIRQINNDLVMKTGEKASSKMIVDVIIEQIKKEIPNPFPRVEKSPHMEADFAKEVSGLKIDIINAQRESREHVGEEELENIRTKQTRDKNVSDTETKDEEHEKWAKKIRESGKRWGDTRGDGKADAYKD